VVNLPTPPILQPMPVAVSPPPQATDPPFGPDYEVIRRAGSGAYGEVCQVRHLPSQEIRAIKKTKCFFNNGDRGYISTKRNLREVRNIRAVFEFSAIDSY
jgi:hypothetical protein